MDARRDAYCVHACAACRVAGRAASWHHLRSVPCEVALRAHRALAHGPQPATRSEWLLLGGVVTGLLAVVLAVRSCG